MRHFLTRAGRCLAAALACAIAASCAAVPETGRGPSAQCLKSLDSVEGLGARSDTVTYREQQMVGPAGVNLPLYAAYGVSEISVREATTENGNARLRVEVCDAGSTKNAYGIFTRLRRADGTPLSVGLRSQLLGQRLQFCRGRYFVVVQCDADFDGMANVLRRVARNVADAIGGTDSLPELSLLPDDDRVPRTDTYTRQGLLGYPFLKEGWSCEYEMREESGTLHLLFPGAAGQDVASVYERFARTHRTVRKINVRGVKGCFVGTNETGPPVVCCVCGDNIVIVTGMADTSKATTLLSRQVRRLYRTGTAKRR